MHRTASLLALVVGSSSLAQSINIDFGTPGTGPSSSYAAAGRRGAWNVLGVMPTSVRFNLVGRDGQPVAATVYNIGGSSLLTHDKPTTTGDDEALLDDMFLSFNNPIDLCLFFEHLANGNYEVITYAQTPDNPMLLSRVRVDNATPGPVMVGGEWLGEHILLNTYSRHTVTVTDGRLNPHSGLQGSLTQSGMNGIQLLYLGPCPGDANGDFDVTFADLNMVLANFGLGGPADMLPGDVNHDGVVNFADLNLVLSNFGRLC